MAHRKIHHTIIILTLTFLIFSCKKRLQKESSIVSISVVNPVTKEPISGVKYVLTEYEEEENGQILGGDDLIETENNPLAEGETDASGSASFDFYKKRDHDFAYIIRFDYAQMDLPSGDYEIVKGGDEYFLEQHEYTHQFNFEVVPYVNYITHIKNFNCQGSDDEMRYRIKYLFTGSGNWTNWTSGFMGCYEYVGELKYKPMEVFVTEIEVTRHDGTFDTYTDTLTVGINPIDTLKIYY